MSPRSACVPPHLSLASTGEKCSPPGQPASVPLTATAAERRSASYAEPPERSPMSQRPSWTPATRAADPGAPSCAKVGREEPVLQSGWRTMHIRGPPAVRTRPQRTRTPFQSQLRLDPATVSAMRACRAPSGFWPPTVVSRTVWCSISAFSSAPSSTTVVESQIQVMKPMAAPSEP